MERDTQVFEVMLRMAGRTKPGRNCRSLVNQLVDASSRLLGADGAWAVMADEGGCLEVAAATDPGARMLAELSLGPGGPSRRAFERRSPVLLTIDRDSSALAVEARRLGTRAMYAVPVGVGRHNLGALCLTWRSLVTLSETDTSVAYALARTAAVGIVNRHQLEDCDRTVDQLQHALDSRVVIEQAKGVLAERGAMSPEQAFEVLRQSARASSRRLGDVARDVVQGPCAAFPPQDR